MNANILSHLERPRVEYLLGLGHSFSAAKAQAQSEVLAIFGITLGTAAWSETLDLSRGNEADAALLAISAMDMRTDLRTDGTLDGSSGSLLMNAAHARSKDATGT